MVRTGSIGSFPRALALAGILMVPAAAMAQVPLAGTNWIPGKGL